TTRRSLDEPVEPPANHRKPSTMINDALRVSIAELASGRFKTAEAFNSRFTDLCQERMRAESALARR
ncbi:MAG: hypothetical protein AVDCRST_MAG64-3806, partial [uncultured Phycisphaerae bacterium]